MSVRTIKRDVSSLQQAGALIWSQPGPGGGYVLDDSASLPPVAFTASQASALATALAVMPPSSPFALDARIAVHKVLDTLNPAARDRTEALVSRIWIARPEANQASPAVLRAIERSLTEQLVLSIRYRTANGTQSVRRVEPIKAAHTAGNWYLPAYCTERESVRWFRFDRIEHADITNQHYQQRPISDAGEPPQHAATVRSIELPAGR